MVKMIAIEPCNQHRPGDEFEATEREADQLEARGLAKMATIPQNKMAQPSENKGNPSQAAGGATRSSASRAAKASPRTTAKKSDDGEKPAADDE